MGLEFASYAEMMPYTYPFGVGAKVPNGRKSLRDVASAAR